MQHLDFFFGDPNPFTVFDEGKEFMDQVSKVVLIAAHRRKSKYGGIPKILVLHLGDRNFKSIHPFVLDALENASLFFEGMVFGKVEPEFADTYDHSFALAEPEAH
jgi:hypothetical protein